MYLYKNKEVRKEKRLLMVSNHSQIPLSSLLKVDAETDSLGLMETEQSAPWPVKTESFFNCVDPAQVQSTIQNNEPLPGVDPCAKIQEEKWTQAFSKWEG